MNNDASSAGHRGLGAAEFGAIDLGLTCFFPQPAVEC
jgi:hypothetical protein